MSKSQRAWDAGNEVVWAREQAREDAAYAREASEYAAWAKAHPREFRIQVIEKRASTLSALAVDGWLSTEQAAERETLDAELEALKAELEAEADAARDAEWTREATESRRAEWNALVKGGSLHKHGKVWWPAVRAQEKKQGWTHEDLAAAVKRHGL